MISFFLYKLGSACCCVLPVRLTYAFAAFLADLNFLVNRRSRRAVLANLARVHDGGPVPADPVRVARRVFHNFALNIVDFLRLPLVDLDSLRRVIRIEGWEHLEAARARGRGVIILSAHIGNWEWAGALFAQSGFKMKAVALEHGAGRVTRFFARRRQEKGIEVLPLTGSTSAMLAWLRQGGVVGLIADRDFTGQGMPVRFFGETAMMPRAHASLALKTGAAVIPSFLVREGEDRFRLIIHPPVPADGLPPGDRVRAFVERCLREFEEVIRRHPDQWSVFEPLWGGPPGAAAPPPRSLLTGTRT